MNPNLTIYSGDRIVTGATLQAQGECAATGFKSLGLKPGDTVAVMLRNDLPYLELMLALGRLGIHLVSVNWHFNADEAAYIFQDSGASALVIHADLWPRLSSAVPASLPVFIVPSPREVLEAYNIQPPFAEANTHDWARWRDQFGPCSSPAEPSIGSMLYTSGTTGRPKAVMRLPGTPAQYEGTRRIRALASKARPGMKTAIVAPLYHAGPNTAARVALELAERIVILPRFDAEQLLQAIETYRLTHLSLVPVMLVRLLKLPKAVRARYDVSSLENVTHGAAPCAPEVRRAMIDWLGPILCETYGSTETGLVTSASSQEWLDRPGTVGKPFAGTSIRILDQEGHVLQPGEVGEIYVDAGNNALPFTYRNNPEARRAIEQDGYVTNGDVGYLDADGYLYITDRKRDMVISGGVNIYPAEIEHAMVSNPEIADCAVFGIPDTEFGEAVAAAVVRTPGSQITEAQVREWVRSRLAGYKVPRHVEFHESLPRESMGKVFKNKLRAPHWERAGRQI